MLSPEPPGQVAGSHWGVENRFHWVLNTHLHEDKTRNRDDDSAYNLAALRHMAFTLMQRDRSRVSLRSKFNLAVWKGGFLAGLLFIKLKGRINAKCRLILIHFVTKRQQEA